MINYAVLEIGDILLFHTNKSGIISSGIEYASDSFFSHTAIVIGKTYDIQKGKYCVSIAEYGIKGMTETNLDFYNNHKYYVECRRYIGGLSDSQKQSIIDKAEILVRINMKYAFTSYIGFIIYCAKRKLGLNTDRHNDNPFVIKQQAVCSGIENIYRPAVDLFPTIGEGFVMPSDYVFHGLLDYINIQI